MEMLDKHDDRVSTLLRAAYEAGRSAALFDQDGRSAPLAPSPSGGRRLRPGAPAGGEEWHH